MSILSKLFHREAKEAAVPEAAGQCLHVALVPRWTDNPADMGNEEKASSWECTACGASFPPDEARRLRETEAERVRAKR